MIGINLNDIQREAVQLQARQAVGRVSERCHFVLVSDQGYSPPEIGQMMGYHPAGVRVWLRGFAAQGLSG